MLQRVVEPTLNTMGYELVLLEWLPTARPCTVRLFVDREGGITLDDCAKLSPIVGNALDAAEQADTDEGRELAAVLVNAYVLEVSSPGLDRPLARRSHYDRFVGARAVVRTHAAIEGASALGNPQKNFKGRIVGTEADASAPDDDELGVVRLADEDEPTRIYAIPLPLVRRANLVYEGEPERTDSPATTSRREAN
ncbi:MAG: ribosome maturation factor RimP [Deltaproteobacteria bacterium]|nr:ribosome maturation factor RimP [Nannocystaceae bacterium]